MDFAPSDIQIALKDALSRYLQARYDFETRRGIIRSPEGWSTEVWSGLAGDMGLCGAAIPEAAGGQGGGAVEVMIAMEALGGAQVVEPFMENLALAAILLDGAGEAAALALSEIAAGDGRLSLAWMEPATRYQRAAPSLKAEPAANGWRLRGEKIDVGAGQIATHVVISADIGGDIGLFLAPRDALAGAVHPYRTIDDRLACDLRFDGLALPASSLLARGEDACARLEKALDAATGAICAEAVGAMRVLVDDTVAYSKERRQFGQAIGQFQALQHRMVDMRLALEQANAAAHLAALKLDAPTPERARAVSAAKLAINSAARMVGQNAVQLHGGMGMTDELRIGHYFKRLTVIEHAYGDSDFHIARYAQMRQAS
jgi:alkylation response protein AidB-like acyl-CoA dehydrogenase